MGKIVRGLMFLMAVGGGVMLPEVASASNCTIYNSEGTPLSYSSTSALGGAGGIQNFGTYHSRIIKLERTYRVIFQCLDNNSVDLSLRLNSLNAPNFPSNSADNLDLIGTDSVGVTHQVTVVNVTNNNTPLVTSINANSNQLIINPLTNGINLALDENDRLTLEITSAFILTGGAEELAAGDYNTEFVLQVTPDLNSGISNSTDINGAVSQQCSVQTPSLYYQRGNIPIPYQPQTRLIAGEQRVYQMSASDAVLFDCNSGAFQYSINLDQLSVPSDFRTNQNLDLITNSTDIGIDHQVQVNLIFPSGNVSNTSANYSQVTTGNVVINSSPNIDLNGDIKIELSSTFVTVQGAEELGAGEYTTRFTITVTAQ